MQSVILVRMTSLARTHSAIDGRHVGMPVVSLRGSITGRMAIYAARVREDFGNLGKKGTGSSLLVRDIGECRGRLEITGTSRLRENARNAPNANNHADEN